MPNEETRSGDELERLRTQKELMELKTKIAELGAPWWRKAGLLAGFGALVAAVLPVTTAIQEHYRNEREFQLERAKQDGELALAQRRQQTDLALAQTKQENDIRTAYFERFAVPGHRRQTLRFLLATSTDERLVAWAREELKIVQEEIDKIGADLAAVEKEIAASPPGKAREDLKKERDELNELRDGAMRRPPPSPTP